MIIDKFRSLRPYLRGFSSDDYNNLLAGDAWMHQTWSGDMAALLWQAPGPVDLRIRGAETGHTGQLRRYAIPVNAQHPGTALLFIDYMLRPENVEKNINYIGYPMPVHGTEATYEEIVADYPECTVTVEDLSPQPLFHQRQRGQDAGPRRRLHGNEGRSMTICDYRDAPQSATEADRRGPRAGSGCGPGCWCRAPSGCRCSSSPRCCCSSR